MTRIQLLTKATIPIGKNFLFLKGRNGKNGIFNILVIVHVTPSTEDGKAGT